MKYGKSILGVALAVMLAASSGYGTYAYFSSQATSSENSITAGTLKLGGVMKNAKGEEIDTIEKFATVTFDNIQPGEPPYKVQTTTLKNVGSLPFYLYRITASALVDNTVGENDNQKDDTKLNEVINVVITIDDEGKAEKDRDVVYKGKLSDLIAENGGHFDPIKEVNPTDKKEMIVNVYMDPEAKNDYQGLSMSCDLTVYASQNEKPIQGDPQGTKYDMGSTDLFSVEGWNDNEWMYFDWDWEPNDKHKEAYKIILKHETGQGTTEIKEVRWWGVITAPWDDVNMTLDGIKSRDVKIEWGEDRIRIRKSVIPSTWKTFEVQLGGNQEFSGDEWWNNTIDYQTIPYQQWSLNKE